MMTDQEDLALLAECAELDNDVGALLEQYEVTGNTQVNLPDAVDVPDPVPRTPLEVLNDEIFAYRADLAIAAAEDELSWEMNRRAMAEANNRTRDELIATFRAHGRSDAELAAALAELDAVIPDAY